MKNVFIIASIVCLICLFILSSFAARTFVREEQKNKPSEQIKNQPSIQQHYDQNIPIHLQQNQLQDRFNHKPDQQFIRDQYQKNQYDSYENQYIQDREEKQEHQIEQNFESDIYEDEPSTSTSDTADQIEDNNEIKNNETGILEKKPENKNVVIHPKISGSGKYTTY